MADILGTVKKILPGMGSALSAGATGNIPGVVSAIAQIVGSVTGKSDIKPESDAVAQAILAANPDQLLALKKQDQDFQVEMESIGLKWEEMANDDRDSARKREISVRDYTPEVGFYLLVLVYLYAIHWLFRYPIPADNKALCYTMLGSLGTLLVTAATYFYGTTRDSGRKTELLAQAPPVNGNGAKK